MAKKSKQMKILDIILKNNPKATVAQAAQAYKILKELEN